MKTGALTGLMAGIKTGGGTLKKKPKKPPKNVVKKSPVGPKPPAADAQLKTAIAEIERQGKQKISDITGYQSAMAELLGQIATQTGSAYSDAAGDIAGYGQGFGGELSQRLAEAGAQAQHGFDAATGGQIKTDVGGSYNAADAGAVGYGLGGYLPARGLREQGAAFQAAAAAAPKAAAQQGLYAVRAAQSETDAQIGELKASYAKSLQSGTNMPKASASLSKTMGMLVDVYGQPILDRKGKPIPVRTGDEITAYQSAQLELSAARHNLSIDKENYGRAKDQQMLVYKDRADQRATEAAIRAGRKIDKTASEQTGFVVFADGTYAKNAKGGNIKYKLKASGANKPRPLTVAQRAKFKGIAMFAAKAGRNGTYDDAGDKISDVPTPYQTALEDIQMKGVPAEMARAQLNRYYARGEYGRPYFDPPQIRRLARIGWPMDLLRQNISATGARMVTSLKPTPANIAKVRNAILQEVG